MQLLVCKYMADRNDKQFPNGDIEESVIEEKLSVAYWREEFKKAFQRFESLTEVADLLATDPSFEGSRGFLRLRNIQAGRGGLQITAKAVRLMLQLRPIKNKTPEASLS